MKHPSIGDLPGAVAGVLVRVIGDRRAAVTTTYAVVMVVMLTALGAGLDLSNALHMKYRFDLAADAASVACGEMWETQVQAGAAAATAPGSFTTLENDASMAAQQQGVNTFMAQAGTLLAPGPLPGPTLVSGFPSVVAAPGTVAVGPGGANAQVACTVTYRVTNPNYIMVIAGITALTIANSSVTKVNLAPFVQIFLVLDSSASMMVGSTPTDQGKIAAWVAENSTSHTNCKVLAPNPAAPPGATACDNLPLTPSNDQGTNSNDVVPCAFACHDTGAATFHVSDMQQGETVAGEVGAFTRFDVMRLALVNDPVTAQFCTPPTMANPPANAVICNTTPPNNSKGLLPFIRDQYTASNARANLNTFVYNMYGFNYGIDGDEPSPTVFDQDMPDNSQAKVVNTNSLSALAGGINTLSIGIDTHFNPPVNAPHTAVMPALQALVGATSSATVPGTSTENPLKFVIILTDGLNSDRNWNYGDPRVDGVDINPDPIPAHWAANPTSVTSGATLCGNWAGATPSIDGTPLWLGSGECNNAIYNPGFLPATATTGSASYTEPATPPAFVLGANNVSVDYADPLDETYCENIKNNGTTGNGTFPGITIAVLETPYVPMTGQDPIYHPYETGVQQVIYPFGDPAVNTSSYPIGPNGTPMSAVSQVLQRCATSPEFYFQATSDAAIANGFITLFTNFVGEYVHIAQ